MRKFSIFILVSIFLLFVGMLWARNFVIKMTIEEGVRAVTGLPVWIDELDIGILTRNVKITELQVFNPDGFHGRTMLDIPEIYIHYRLLPLWENKVHLREVRLDLKEFVIVKNEQGKFNFDSLRALQPAVLRKEQVPAARPGVSARKPDLQIDVLFLRIGKVVYKDYSKGGNPSVQEFRINLNEKYQNITDRDALAQIIAFRALTNTAVKTFINYDVKLLGAAIRVPLKTAQVVTVGTIKTTGDIVGGTWGGAKKIVTFPFRKRQ